MCEIMKKATNSRLNCYYNNFKMQKKRPASPPTRTQLVNHILENETEDTGAHETQKHPQRRSKQNDPLARYLKERKNKLNQ